MASTFERTLSIDKIAEATSSAGVTVEDTLKVDSIADASASGLTFSSDVQFDEDVTVGGVSDPQTLTVYRDIFASRQVSAPNMVVGRKFVINYSDLSAASTTETYALPVFSHGWVPFKAFTVVLQAFDAPSLSALTWTVGWGTGTVAADPDGLLLVGDSDGTATGQYQKEDSHKGVALDGTADYLLASNNEPTVSFTATGANLDTLTQGILHVIVFYAREPEAF